MSVWYYAFINEYFFFFPHRTQISWPQLLKVKHLDIWKQVINKNWHTATQMGHSVPLEVVIQVAVHG